MASEPSNDFNPYDEWFRIPPHEQPADHYRLLGLSRFESRLKTIESGYDDRMERLHQKQTGPRALHAERLKEEVAKAFGVLRDPKKRAEYDIQLRGAQAVVPVARPLPQTPLSRPIPVSPVPVISTVEAAANPLQVTLTTATRLRSGPRRKKSPLVETLKIAGGGLIGIALALGIVNYLLGRDLFGIFPKKGNAQPTTIADVPPASVPGGKVSSSPPSPPPLPSVSRPSAPPTAPATEPATSPKTNGEPATAGGRPAGASDDAAGSTTASTTVSAGGKASSASTPNRPAARRRFRYGDNKNYALMELVGPGYWVKWMRSQGVPLVWHYREVSRSDDGIELESFLEPARRMHLTADQYKESLDGGITWQFLHPGNWLDEPSEPLVQPTFEPGEPVDLLQSAGSHAYCIYGSHRYDSAEGRVSLDAGSHLHLPVRLPRSYVFKAKLLRTSGTEGLSIGLRMRDTPIWLILDSGEEHFSGLQGIAGKWITMKPYDVRVERAVLKDGETANLTIRVDDRQFVAEVDGKTLFTFAPKEDDLVFPFPNFGSTHSDHLWIESSASFDLSDIQVTPLEDPSEGRRARHLAAADSQFESLFNGTNLDKWADPGALFGVENGLLTTNDSQAVAGLLTSKDAWEDFELRLQLKMEKDCDSGILFQLPGVALPRGWGDYNQLNLGCGWNSFRLGETSLRRPELQASATIRPNDWTTWLLRVLDGRAELYINDVKAFEYPITNTAGPARGRIAIERFAGKFWIKQIDIRPLPPLARSPDLAGSGQSSGSSEKSKRQAVLEKLENDFETFDRQMVLAKKEMLQNFKAVEASINKNPSLTPNSPDVLKQLERERDAFERAGYLPFSQPMRSRWSEYLELRSKAETRLRTAFDRQIAGAYKAKDEETVQLLEEERERRLAPTVVAHFRVGNDWLFYSDGSVKNDTRASKWTMNEKGFVIKWPGDRGPLIDTCTLSQLGDRFDGANQYGVRFGGSAVQP